MFNFLKRKKEIPKRTIVVFRNKNNGFNYDSTQVMKIKDLELQILRKIAERSNITLFVK